MSDRAARELDALVAEKVMGIEHDYRGCWWCARDFAGEPYPRHNSHFRRYSTDIAAAWEVMEKMKREGGNAIEVYWGWKSAETPHGDKWCCTVTSDDDGYAGVADTAPHAICLAALKAVGVDVA